VNTAQWLTANFKTGFTQVVGIGGIGSGKIIALEGEHTLGRDESRLGSMLKARDYCKLHIVEHYIASLMGAGRTPASFRVVAVGDVGDDGIGASLIQQMNAVGINTEFVRILSEYPTLFSVCFLYPDGSGGNITTSNSAASALDQTRVAACRPLLQEAGNRGIALCLPEVPLHARREFLRIASECGSYRVASFAFGELETAKKEGLFANIDLLAINREEAAAVAGVDGNIDQVLEACATGLSASSRSMRLIVSAGSGGVCVFDQGRWSKHDAIPVEVVSTAGAGDALLAGTIAGLTAGLPLRSGSSEGGERELSSAIDLGILLASFSVTSPHTIHPDANLSALVKFASDRGYFLSTSFLQACAKGECIPVASPSSAISGS
jgi:sugar/nucleoside kinase (ribokinase family)